MSDNKRTAEYTPAKEDNVTIDTLESLTHGAKVEQDIINTIDEQIAGFQKKRAEHAKKLRSLTTKIVTLQIKAAK